MQLTYGATPATVGTVENMSADGVSDKTTGVLDAYLFLCIMRSSHLLSSTLTA
jgi:hypothetical protein